MAVGRGASPHPGPPDRVTRSVGSYKASDPALSGAHPHHGVDRDDPDLAVTDLAGGGGGDDGIDHVIGLRVIDEHLDPEFGHEVHFVLRPR